MFKWHCGVRVKVVVRLCEVCVKIDKQTCVCECLFVVFVKCFFMTDGF